MCIAGDIGDLALLASADADANLVDGECNRTLAKALPRRMSYCIVPICMSSSSDLKSHFPLSMPTREHLSRMVSSTICSHELTTCEFMTTLASMTTYRLFPTWFPGLPYIW